jgi:hypothetical protein
MQSEDPKTAATDEDPTQTFPNFMELPETIQIEIMSYCDLRTKLSVSETCSHLHNLLWSSPMLSGRIRLNLRSYAKSQPRQTQLLESQHSLSELDIVQENQKRGRKYKAVKIYRFSSNLHRTIIAKLIDAASILGETVTDLTVDMGEIKIADVVRLLQCFPSVEKLMLDGFMEAAITEANEPLETEGILKNLKELNVDMPCSMILKIVEKVDGLTRFTYQNSKYGATTFDYGVKKLEDFIIKQTHLKELKVYGMESFPLFERNRIDEITFQLENLFAVCFFIHRENVIQFFKHQQSIRHLHLIDFFNPEVFSLDRPNYTNILDKIFRLPKLESLVIGHGRTILLEDFAVLRDICNKSVKQIEYIGENSAVVENFFEIFPCTESFKFDWKHVKFSRFSIENLEKLSVERAVKFSFTPSRVEVSRQEFESSLIEFIRRHKKIESLVVGHKDWIGSDFGLSLNFLKNVVYCLPALQSIEIFNPLQLDQSLTLLNHIYSHKLHF